MSNLKQLDQSVFERDDCPYWAKSAAVDGDGHAAYFAVDKCRLVAVDECGGFWAKNCCYVGQHEFIGSIFDSSDWKNSAITREDYYETVNA